MRMIRSLSRIHSHAILRVTQYKDGMLKGWLFHPRLNVPINILSIPHLLFALDELLERDDIPFKTNSFEKQALPMNPIATLKIQILFREHATWQGVIIWEDQQMEGSFLSVLEMIKIMDEILAE